MKQKKTEIERLFKSHYVKMYAVARSYLYDDAESKDVVIEVFAGLLDSAIVLLPATEEHYLLSSVRHRCMNVIAHKQIRERVAGLLVNERENVSFEEDNEQLDMLMKFINKELPPLTKQIFLLRHIQEMSYQEMADKLGVSKVTVYNHLSLAMDKIKAEFRRTEK